MNTNAKSLIASEYVNVVKTFLKQSDVLTGKALAYHPDKSKPLNNKNWFTFGDSFVTTGFCVAVSQAILEDPIFQTFLNYRQAKAKLVSIDIKEQFYGFCKPSYLPNKWHTAIYVEDSGFSFIVDATCAQFGNAYVGKLVWDFTTWCETFRSVTDQHQLTNFDGMELTTSISAPKIVNEFETNDLKTSLFDAVLSSESERDLLSKFLKVGYRLFNQKTISGALQDKDLKFINIIHSILKKFDVKANTDMNEPKYGIIEFDSSTAMKKFIKYLMDNSNDGEYGKETILPFYVLAGSNLREIGKEFSGCFDMLDDYNSKRFLVIKFNTSVGTDLRHYINNVDTLVPAGSKIVVDFEKDFYNYFRHNKQDEQSNTYVLEVYSML